ncbi:MAG: cobalamin biosynthesis protein CobQ [Oscillospiraceae bacterium]|nr:cobalamin biosynthesis protein CobQ [Oscillospiraceae bacterium]
MKKIIVITGHYGAGKTNFAVNLALKLSHEGHKSAVADLDIVNPYFCTHEFGKMFEEAGITLVASNIKGTSSDVPAVNLNVGGVLANHDVLIIDAGGDDEGAKVLGRYAPELERVGYEMYYVVNCNRIQTQTAEATVQVLRAIESACGLKATAIFNNSHLCGETTADTFAESLPYADEVAALTGLPLLNRDVEAFPIEVYVKLPWFM